MAKKMLNSMPVKMWIDGKIFNIKRASKQKRKIKAVPLENCTELIEIENCESIQEEYVKLLDIREEEGKFSSTFRLPKLYYTKLQNLPNFSIEKLSEITDTKIVLPKLGEDGEISLHSNNRNNLLQAISHIHSAVGEIRDRNVALQFVCIPCLNENVKEKFENLKREILNMENDIKGLHESIFICPLKLHITIDICVLLDEREKAEAVRALNDYRTKLETILGQTGPLKIEIRGLECMNENVKKVDVMYAKVKMVNETMDYNLQKIVNDISEYFYHRGLVKKYQDNVKLHMTVINTKYRRVTDSPKRKRLRQSIDATKIFEKFKDYSFGQCNFDSIYLAHISTKGEDGFYKPLAVLKLNENKDIK